MGVRSHRYQTVPETAEACCHHIIARLEEALSGSPQASLALSGGSSPKPLFEALAATRFPWSRVHLFWVDERCVPPQDPQSNFAMAEEWLIRPARIPSRNIHRIRGEIMPDLAAREYMKEIRAFFGLKPDELPHFDVIHRGIGADAHTGSLFPGDPLLEDREHIAAAVYIEALTQWRVTMLPGVFLAARHNVVYATGEDKAEAVRAVFEEPYDPKQHPAQVVTHHGRAVAWFLDAAAAGKLSG